MRLREPEKAPFRMELHTDFEALLEASSSINWQDLDNIKNDVVFAGVGDATAVVMQMRQDKLRFQTKPLHTSLLLAPSRMSVAAYEKKAVEIHKLILVLTGERGAGTKGLLTQFQALYDMVATSASSPSTQNIDNMAAEFFYQLMKHLTYNPKFESECLSWRLLCFAMCCVKIPDLLLMRYILSFLLEHQASAALSGIEDAGLNRVVSQSTHYCIQAARFLQRDRLPYEQVPPPSLGAFLVFEPCMVDVLCPDGTSLMHRLPLKPSWKPSDLCKFAAFHAGFHAEYITHAPRRWRILQRFVTDGDGLDSGDKLEPLQVTCAGAAVFFHHFLDPDSFMFQTVREVHGESDASRRYVHSLREGTQADLNIIHLQNSLSRYKAGVSVVMATSRKCALVVCLRAQDSIPTPCRFTASWHGARNLPEVQMTTNQALIWRGDQAALALQFSGEHLGVIYDAPCPTSRSIALPLCVEEQRMMFCQAVADVCDGRSIIPNLSISTLSGIGSSWLQSTFGSSRTNAAIAAACAGVAVADGSLGTLGDIMAGTDDFFNVLCAREPHVLADLQHMLTNAKIIDSLQATCVDAGLEGVMYEIFLRHACAHPSFGGVSFAVECVEELAWAKGSNLEGRVASTSAALRDAASALLHSSSRGAQLRSSSSVRLHRKAADKVMLDPLVGRNVMLMSSIAGILLRFESVDGMPVSNSIMHPACDYTSFMLPTMAQGEQLFVKHENCRWAAHSDSCFAIDVLLADECLPSKTFVMTPMRGDPHLLQAHDIISVLEDNKRAWQESSAAAEVLVEGGRLHFPSELMATLHHPHRICVRASPLHVFDPDKVDVASPAGDTPKTAFVSQLFRVLSPKKRHLQ